VDAALANSLNVTAAVSILTVMAMKGEWTGTSGGVPVDDR